ncbi:class IIb bacteriocin, lactobin A/cerein 7B family [Flavobacterium hydrophilum]|nr:class IIb bacteriocin, lactobin A/cerein 7B family [Flavobacterium hydrophilum]
MKFTAEVQEKGAELMKTLAQKAWESTAFKEQLVNNPVATIEQVTGKTLPTDKKIIVDDQTDESVIYFNIPAKVNFDELELTEEQLEMIAGGITPVLGAYALGVGIGLGLCWVASHI